MWINFAAWSLDGVDHAGMAVAGGDDGDAGVQVEEAVAIDVLDDGAVAARDHERVGARVGRRENARVALDDGFRLGAGQWRDQIRQIVTN